MRGLIKALLAIVAAASIAALACLAAAEGAATAALSYRQQVRALCADTRREVRAFDPAEMRRAVLVAGMRKYVAAAAAFSTRFGRLDPPASLRAVHLRTAVTWRREVVLLRALLSRLVQGEKYERLVTTPLWKRLDAADDELKRDFKGLGVPECND